MVAKSFRKISRSRTLTSGEACWAVTAPSGFVRLYPRRGPGIRYITAVKTVLFVLAALNAEPNPPNLQILIDADACPASIKDILFRTARRLQVRLTVVANQTIRVPESDLIQVITVTDGADVADDRIIQLMQAGDIVVTGDIPLAARVVEKSGIAIGTRGELYDDKSVHGRLATRNLMEQFRSSGIETGGPRPMSQKDVQKFANVLDRTLTRQLRRR